MNAPPHFYRVCRHCGRPKVNRPRGLCWSCYYAPGVRDLYASTSPFGRRGAGQLNRNVPPERPTAAWPGSPAKRVVLEERAAAGVGLWHPDDVDLTITATDDATRPEPMGELDGTEEVFEMTWKYHAVGVRTGEAAEETGRPALVLDSYPTEEKAVAAAKNFVTQLEDYVEVRVEKAGPGCSVTVLHTFPGLAATGERPTAAIVGFPWLGRQPTQPARTPTTEKPKLCKHDLLPGECANCALDPQPPKEEQPMKTAEAKPSTNGTSEKTWEEMNRLEKSAAVRAAVKDLGPDRGIPELMQALANQGMAGFGDNVIRRARKQCGFPPLPNGPRPGVSKPNQPATSPATAKKPGPKLKPAVRALVPTPAASDEDESPLVSLNELVAYFAAVKAIGGPAIAQQLLEVYPA
jgi:hypothetical protein